MDLPSNGLGVILQSHEFFSRRDVDGSNGLSWLFAKVSGFGLCVRKRIALLLFRWYAWRARLLVEVDVEGWQNR
jgi:hypothetical protein